MWTIWSTTAEKHNNTFRYIYDVITWGTLPPPEDIYNLAYSEQTLDDGSATFLGGMISTKPNGHIVISVFDMTEHWDFPIVRYMHADTNLPAHITRGIFHGQLQY